ncbi:hypothetical protein [Aestuariivita sp.]|uniref:hypothetical protein n=1 Tax=Aestuariivita sp. TaxID=1872407 RepID=UPI0021718540|nr:hypothetical protein [Aestuariivita sp.]MCE8006368.1 hypothetical protein [Aestuariivita sp.]
MPARIALAQAGKGSLHRWAAAIDPILVAGIGGGQDPDFAHIGLAGFGLCLETAAAMPSWEGAVFSVGSKQTVLVPRYASWLEL